MPENHVRPRSGAEAVAIDNRAEIAKVRFHLFVSILITAGLAFALSVLTLIWR